MDQKEIAKWLEDKKCWFDRKPIDEEDVTMVADIEGIESELQIIEIKNFRDELNFIEGAPDIFIGELPNGHRYLIKREGYKYPRYVARILDDRIEAIKGRILIQIRKLQEADHAIASLWDILVDAEIEGDHSQLAEMIRTRNGIRGIIVDAQRRAQTL